MGCKKFKRNCKNLASTLLKKLMYLLLNKNIKILAFDNGEIEIKEIFGFFKKRSYFIPKTDERRALRNFSVYESIFIKCDSSK